MYHNRIQWSTCLRQEELTQEILPSLPLNYYNVMEHFYLCLKP